jgi:isopenicillin N synthase-like dioxygenase
MTSSIPLIDVSTLASPDKTIRAETAKTLGQACREVGFFYATGHGIPTKAIAAAFAGSRAFFALAPADKARLSIALSSDNRGYVDLSEEKLDPTADFDRKEAFNIGLEGSSGGANMWPDLPGWRAQMLDYFDRCWAFGRQLHRGFSLDLGLDEGFFEDKLDSPAAVLRLLHYPAGGLTPPQSLGAGEHTDYGNITILAVDGEPGLEVRDRQGHWRDAPSIAGAFVCNIGDCLMRWSNDIYVSTPHRVRIPVRERYSIAFFLDPNPDALVTPIAGQTVAKYPPILACDYVRSRLEATYLREK